MFNCGEITPKKHENMMQKHAFPLTIFFPLRKITNKRIVREKTNRNE